MKLMCGTYDTGIADPVSLKLRRRMTHPRIKIIAYCYFASSEITSRLWHYCKKMALGAFPGLSISKATCRSNGSRLMVLATKRPFTPIQGSRPASKV